MDNFLLAPDSTDYGAHLGALKITWIGNKLWSFGIKVLKVHQTSGKALEKRPAQKNVIMNMLVLSINMNNIFVLVTYISEFQHEKANILNIYVIIPIQFNKFKICIKCYI